MKILKAVKPINRSWSQKVTCGTIPNGPPVKGCNSEILLSETDIYYRDVPIPGGVGRSFHWKCPICQAVNSISHTDITDLQPVSHEKYFNTQRKTTIIAIAKLYPASDRADVVSSLCDEALLDEDVVRSIIEDKSLWF